MGGAPGFVGPDFQLCPRCGLRADLDDELSNDLTIALECPHCGNTGTRDRLAHFDPIKWAHGVEVPYEIGEQCQENLQVTVTRAAGNVLVISLMGDQDAVMAELGQKTAKFVQRVLDRERTLSLD